MGNPIIHDNLRYPSLIGGCYWLWGVYYTNYAVQLCTTICRNHVSANDWYFRIKHHMSAEALIPRKTLG